MSQSRRRLIRALLVLVGVLGVFVVVLLAAAIGLGVVASSLPDLRSEIDTIDIAQTSIVYASDGTVLAEWDDGERRTVVSQEQMSPEVRSAVVAIEDRRFFEHGGVDLRAIGRALSRNVESGGVREGGSTITQQTVKLLYTDGERTLSRKVREAVLATAFETRADKDDVLDTYLNLVYFGRGAYGVESAAQRFFGVPARELTLSQSALLAGCIQSPTRYDPFVNPEAALERRNLVLSVMSDEGLVTLQRAQDASSEPLKLKEEQPQTPPRAPYFVEYVRRELLQQLGSDTLYKGGLRIHTTLDPAAQTSAEDAARSSLSDSSDPDIALVSVRIGDGAVVALVGGRDFAADQFDLATQGRRQPGSAFKPFVLTSALENGYTTASTFSAAPYKVQVKDEMWHVENYENRLTGGEYTLEQSTIHSINTVYARLIVELGPEKVVNAAKRLGITSQVDPDPAIALGGLKEGVSPLEMASAYSTFANSGVAVSPSGVAQVLDSQGGLVYQPDRTGRPAIDPAIAATVSEVLNKVYTSGTGAGAQMGRWAAVKTGTSQSHADAWTIGWSDSICTAVWVGYREGQIPMTDVHGVSVTGGSFPAAAWKRFMTTYAERRVATTEDPIESMPPGDEIYRVCSDSIKLANPSCPSVMELLLPIGALGGETCPLHP